MHRLRGTIRNYDWGWPDALSKLTRQPLSGQPEAELWLGAHATAPSLVLPEETPLDTWIDADPDTALGPEVAEHFDGLPFLLKVLAAAQPLSLQAHPSAAEAAAGFAREEAAQIAMDDPRRTFKDPHHKPELICAITSFRALCGFRDSNATLDLLESIGAPVLAPMVEILRRDDGSHGRRRALLWVLTQSDTDTLALVAAVADSSAIGSDHRWFAERTALAELAARYPADAAVLGAALLNLVELRPGEALFLGAGNLHAYLHGIGVEILANSDNVVRAGMTSKHVDIDLLVDIVDFDSISPRVQRPEPTSQVFRYETPVPEFSLSRYRVETRMTIEEGGPAIVLCVEGQCELSDGSSQILMESGDAVWLAAGGTPVQAVGDGLLFCAAAGNQPANE